ncbi:probable acyltransferase [Reinekea sp. MED297]|uniref:Probable acyltransferase n=2 Tax=Reinekea TaxID=230494 RepID=A4BAA9_9GAMM|nr:probable acyltransferase [Reinekea sp. MED297] [Reinekea blandensis MED297]
MLAYTVEKLNKLGGAERMLISVFRTVLFYLVSVPFTMTWALIFGFIAFLIPYPARYHVVIGGWAQVMHFLTVYVLGIRVRVHGRENIPEEPCVIISNHQSAWETYYMQHLFKPQTQVAKASLLKIPLFGWTFGLMKPIAIDRSNRRQAMSQIVDQGKARMADGCSVLIFPEGTRTRPGEPLPFRKGGAVLAKAAGAPMVPVSHNSGEYWPSKSYIKRAGVIDIYIHKPIPTDQGDPEALMREAQAVVYAQMERMQKKPRTAADDLETGVTA